MVVLAAGMGSRYGGTKQLDAVTEAGATIMDFSIYDAIKAGFTKVVLVLRKDILDEVKIDFDKKFKKKVALEYVCQTTENIPVKYKNFNRTKPWGTGQALLVAKQVVHNNFCVINADDFYGFEAFASMFQFLTSSPKPNQYAMVGYLVQNTLSDNGSVSRGQCFLDENQALKHIIERTSIQKKNSKIIYKTEQDTDEFMPNNTLVSMNFWGFQPDFFKALETEFDAFLSAHNQDLKSEFLLPTVVDSLISRNSASVSVLQSHAKWMGVTYKQDKESVVASIKVLLAANKYPAKLW